MEGKALALLSGGLDSTLAVKMVRDMGLEVEAVHFTTPFCQCDKCSVDTTAERLDIKVHHVFLGDEFLAVVADPPHGRGSQMNVCIDCRILMLRKAKRLAEEIGAGFFVTGEVLGQRPMSQHGSAMRLIEREAGVESLVLRPLSGKLMKETRMEDEGIVDRERLLDISGRRRLPQMELAEKLGVYDYPCPSGGCLLTDPEFAARLRDYLENEGTLTIETILLLKAGRHFRVGSTRIVVGRNEVENNLLEGLAHRGGTRMEVEGHNGPVTLVVGDGEDAIRKAAALTVRYSDAPRGEPVWVVVASGDQATRIQAEAIAEGELESIRIQKKGKK
jgi:tRNA U34 2-thiouridine synthase MnmA/TrmU